MKVITVLLILFGLSIASDFYFISEKRRMHDEEMQMLQKSIDATHEEIMELLDQIDRSLRVLENKRTGTI